MKSGGYWAPVELRHQDSEQWQALYQKGMRALVDGRTVREEWEDCEEEPRVTVEIEARRVAVLPYRLARVKLMAQAEPTADPSIGPA